MQYVKNTMIDGLLSSIAPHPCSSCGEIGALLCDNCKSYITRPANDECWTCGERKTDNTCQECRHFFDNTIIVGLRQGGLQRVIGGLKFQYKRAAAKECAVLLVPQLHSVEFDVLVPIPTTEAHKRVRGYDHMTLITKEVSRLTGKPIYYALKAVSRMTFHRLGRKDRIIAAESLFAVQKSVQAGVRYLIVDDIITTGSTVRRAALLLRQAGATHVSVAAIARQPSTKQSISVKMGKVQHEPITER